MPGAFWDVACGDALVARLRSAREELGIAEKLLEDRDRLLAARPCPVHGPCVPYTLEALREQPPELLIFVSTSPAWPGEITAVKSIIQSLRCALLRHGVRIISATVGDMSMAGARIHGDLGVLCSTPGGATHNPRLTVDEAKVALQLVAGASSATQAIDALYLAPRHAVEGGRP